MAPTDLYRCRVYFTVISTSECPSRTLPPGRLRTYTPLHYLVPPESLTPRAEVHHLFYWIHTRILPPYSTFCWPNFRAARSYLTDCHINSSPRSTVYISSSDVLHCPGDTTLLLLY